MSRKGENIFRRKDGRWEARYPKGYAADGKIKYGFCYGKTYREAKVKAEQARAALLTNRPLPAAGGAAPVRVLLRRVAADAEAPRQGIHLCKI